MGLISIALFFLNEIVFDWWLSGKFPDYNWQQQSISYLGQRGSPLLTYVEIWGVVFTLLLTIFICSVFYEYKDIPHSKVAAILLLIYAWGEGIGSAFFPINAPGQPFDKSAMLHNIFSSSGDLCLMGFTALLIIRFRSQYTKSFYYYLGSVLIIGISMGSMFSIAKYYRPNNMILEYKGIWQRLYNLNFHLMLLLIGFHLTFRRAKAVM